MEPTQKSNGAFAGLVIIIIILIIGGIYLWKNNSSEINVEVDNPDSQPAAETNNIDAELEAVDLEELDSGI